ncbi:disease resistance protein RPS4-like [Durio zibethinus]|uniref:Disease resistance protein RPS4-like n=1 Tax=Durio zibethinus TaxID=66656 RepID=A0A6P5Y570_DURZI|nr:disease resistance protein RPS4-like [Durio zibethinus]
MESLYELVLLGCSNLQRFPEIDGEMKCLQLLHLDGTGIEELSSSIVETLPENLLQVEFLEELDLSETSITMPSSFIFQFKNLKVLFFKGCQGTTDSMALMLPPLSETLTRLSNLDWLDLVDCRKLKALPKPLPMMKQVGIDDCALLEEAADPLTAIGNDSLHRGFDEFGGNNSFKLAEKNNPLTLLKKIIKVFANVTRVFDIFVPGSEIPEWFNHRTDGSSIKITLSPNIQNDSQWVGVALCCVFVNDEANSFDNDRWKPSKDICRRRISAIKWMVTIVNMVGPVISSQ